MAEYLNSTSISKGSRVTGWILSILPVLIFIMSASFKFNQPGPDFAEGVTKMGWTPEVMFKLGFVELACAIIYIIPQTSYLGAILLTAYMGGAVATHLRVEEPFYLQILIGVFIWGGLWLRDTRLRELIPFRS